MVRSCCPNIRTTLALDSRHGLRDAAAFLLMVVSGWVHRQHLIVIEFLQAENRLLKERLRGKRIRFTDAERALLARKAKAVGRKALLELETIVSPDPLMRWHRRLIAEKWNFAHRRGPGRPGIMREIADLIVRLAQGNPNRGRPPELPLPENVNWSFRPLTKKHLMDCLRA